MDLDVFLTAAFVPGPAADDALLLQLDRRIPVVGRSELTALRAGIDDVPLDVMHRMWRLP